MKGFARGLFSFHSLGWGKLVNLFAVFVRNRLGQVVKLLGCIFVKAQWFQFFAQFEGLSLLEFSCFQLLNQLQIFKF